MERHRKHWSPWPRRLVALLLLLPLVPATAAEVYPISDYHTHGPFQVGPGVGLTADLATYLSDHSGGRYRFEVLPVSRARLAKQLDSDQPVILPWVSPDWFDDAVERRFRWSRAVMLEDGNAVISHRLDPIDYAGPQSLDSRVLGGVKGYQYTGIDEAIAASADIDRVDTNSYDNNLAKLVMLRIDVMLMPRSAIDYTLMQREDRELFYISPTPHSRYQRRMLIKGVPDAVADYLEDQLEAMGSDPRWREILESYR